MFVKLLEDIVTLFKKNNMNVSTCCGAEVWSTEDPICSECKEHCDVEEIHEDEEPSN